ncbi:hypothetical protein E5843_02365 [Luteimonas yindakuii]|uniref:hypothetical protein n=1 Tax=Luteimonas yindakuii TaxID=2565782 RepID=UPI0010A57B8E|nr:hypothetical protein [Luteimonas yindakuii]QCO66922.1 hypothetical protein E5843_02365 [Luteimonas yindakuii]
MPPIAPLALALLLAVPAAAQERPEISREPAKAQADGAAHTLRTIPEACARIEGVFTGQAEPPYRFSVKQTSPGCQPRARLVNADDVAPDPAQGWLYHDEIRIPSAACSGLVAVARIWRKPGTDTLELDAQGRARIYLDQAKADAEAGRVRDPAMYAAQLRVEGNRCR